MNIHYYFTRHTQLIFITAKKNHINGLVKIIVYMAFFIFFDSFIPCR